MANNNHKIDSINSRNIKTLKDAAQKALDKVSDLYGVTIKIGNIRYDNLSFRTKINCTVDNPSTGIPYEQNSFNQACYLFGLKSEHYLSEIQLSGGRKFHSQKAKVYGFNTRSKKYPVLARLDNGQLVKCGKHILSQISQ